MAGFLCPFCGQVMVENSDTLSRQRIGFNEVFKNPTGSKHFAILIHACPNCDEWTIEASNGYDCFEGKRMLNPISVHLQFPEYIPEAIRNDYEEAQAIKYLSPKASATLARRCLQGMIHDFWNIKEKNLNAEISSLQSKIPASQWSAIDGLRKIGNIGAHMEKDVELIIDVDPEEADKLLKLIELLLEKWYVSRHDDEQLLLEITEMATAKEEARSR